MKKKIISLFLACFLVVSTSFNSFAYSKQDTRAIDGGLISVPVAGVILTLAVGAGIVLNSQTDIDNFLNSFFYNSSKDLGEVEELFKTCVTIGSNKVVSVGKDFLNYVLDVFDSMCPQDSVQVTNFATNFDFGNFSSYNLDYGQSIYFTTTLRGYFDSNRNITTDELAYGTVCYALKRASSSTATYPYSVGFGVRNAQGFHGSFMSMSSSAGTNLSLYAKGTDGLYNLYSVSSGSVSRIGVLGLSHTFGGSYNPSYDREKEYTGLNVPSDLNSLVGNGVDVFNPSYDLPVDGVVSAPGSSIIDDTVTFPLGGTTDTPTDTPTDTTWDWLINLVVPSDTYFTDTFSAKLELAQNKLPFLDLTPLQKLAAGETPFPNIDIKIMGSNVSRILNSDDTLNKVVSFFRPIIQAFVSVFMLLYGYNQVYYLIRGTYPIKVGRGSDD